MMRNAMKGEMRLSMAAGSAGSSRGDSGDDSAASAGGGNGGCSTCSAGGQQWRRHAGKKIGLSFVLNAQEVTPSTSRCALQAHLVLTGLRDTHLLVRCDQQRAHVVHLGCAERLAPTSATQAHGEESPLKTALQHDVV